MKVLLIPDKFKSSLKATEVIESIRKGVLSVFPEASFNSVLASDGGDGFLDSVAANIECEIIEIDTFDPKGRAITAEYLSDAKNHAAYIELAKASGLALLKKSEYDVMHISTFGTGLQIKDAIEKGHTSIYLGLGGSATNDAGIGIANALGFYFLDSDGEQIVPSGKNISKIVSIHKGSNSPSLKGISFFAVNDVDNPLFGPEGAAYTYAKQKGAGPKEIVKLDNGLMHFANTVKQQTNKDLAELKGSGAAGGAGYGLKVFCDAEFVSGIDFIFKISEVEKVMAENNFDYIITGEGKFDGQTLYGKLVKGVIDLGKRFDVPVLAICGQLDLEKNQLKDFENLTVLEIRNASKPLKYNLENAAQLIENSLESFLRG